MKLKSPTKSLRGPKGAVAIPWYYFAVFVIALFALTTLITAAIAHAGESGVSPNVISVPDGPGSIEGLGEEFEPAANSGTANYGIEIAVPEGSGGSKPSVKINYDSGKGNSSLGFGWSAPLPRIQRQTDKGLPRYDATDTYIYQDGSIGEELVPLADGSFRLKTEGAFIRATKNGAGWEVRAKNGVIYRLGETADSRVRDSSGTKTFAWNISSIVDTNGNSVVFEWSTNGNQSYISKIKYNDYGSDVVCEILFTYEARPDALIDYRATFPITNALRLKKIEVRRGGNLVRAYGFSYDAALMLSRLAKVTLTGSDGKTEMPPLTFEYTKFAPQDQSVVEMANPPSQALIDPKNALVDVNGDALPDVLVTDAGNHRYYINEDGVNWSDSYTMSSSPSYDLSQEGVRLADINGDGISDLVVAKGVAGNSYFPGSQNAQWQTSIPFDQNPVGFRLEDPDTRMVDLNGDRLIDVLRTNATGLSAWIHTGAGSFERLGSLPSIDSGVLFSDPQIELADFNGDGLVDVARLRSGSLIYWPSTGYGRFDAPVTLSGVPTVDDETRLKAIDLNGDGLADVVYLGVSHVRYWLNRGNNSLTETYTINNTPTADPATTSVQFADMNGNGTTDIVWVDVSDGPSGSWRYLDVLGDQFTGLITEINNGLGKIASIEYESSTAQMIRADASGDPWSSTIPFPVSIIRKVTIDDSLGSQTVTEYNYRDGYYDGEEREFFGFGGALKNEYGDESIEGLLIQWTFDVGKTDETLKGKILDEQYSGESGTIYKEAENTWKAQTLADGSDGRKITFTELTTVVSSTIEGTSSPRYTRQDLYYDEYGNVIDELNHGEIASAADDGSIPFGNDEVFTHRDFAINATNWILDRVSRERVRDGSGTRLADTINYYDGAVFVGLPRGQVDKGNLTQQEKWLRTEDRYVSTMRNRRDAWGNITAILDANGGRREIFYDSKSHTDPVRERIFTGSEAMDFVAEYDDTFGKVNKFTEPNGVETLFAYDKFGRVASVVKPGDSAQLPTTGYEYNVSSPISTIAIRAREISGSAGTLDSYKFVDGLGRTRAEAGEDDGGGFFVTKTVAFNSRGKESFTADPFRCVSLGNDCLIYGASLLSKSGTSSSFDAMGRTIKTQNPDGSYILAEYKPFAELLYDENDVDSNSAHHGTPSTRHFDGQGRVISISIKNGTDDVTTGFAYDGLGNITSVTDPSGSVRSQTYDALGRMISIDDPNAGHRDFIYDDVGNLVEKRKPDGSAIRYQYETTTGRILAKNLVATPDDDTWEVKYHYDYAAPDFAANNLKGRLAWVEDQIGKEYFNYDLRGQTVAKRRMIGSQNYDLAFTLDTMGRQIGMTYPDGISVGTIYNGRGAVKSIGSYLIDRTYNASGQVEKEVLGDGITKNYTYDARHRISDLSVTNAAGETIQNFHYNLDAAGNIMRIDDARDVAPEKLQTQSFVYDDLYRLTKSETPAGTISWGYDSIGNITQRTSTLEDTRLNADVIKYAENGAGPYAMTTAGDKTYEYDVNGNLVKMPGQTLAYDAEDRLVKVTKDDGTIVEMIYGYDGNRKVKRVTKPDASVVETDYVDPNYEVRGDQHYKYIWADGKRIARDDS